MEPRRSCREPSVPGKQTTLAWGTRRQLGGPPLSPNLELPTENTEPTKSTSFLRELSVLRGEKFVGRAYMIRGNPSSDDMPPLAASQYSTC
jgi:hypothetical protein